MALKVTKSMSKVHVKTKSEIRVFFKLLYYFLLVILHINVYLFFFSFVFILFIFSNTVDIQYYIISGVQHSG